MATVVCQGLQSTHESQLTEERALRLRLSPKPHFSQSLELAWKSCFLDSNNKEHVDKCFYQEATPKADIIHDKYPSLNPDMGGWSFLQALSNPCQGFKQKDGKESVYVHPLMKRSSSRLSEKSLELCTENLGSETGTEIIENSFFLSASMESKEGNSPTREQKKSCHLIGAYTNKKGSTSSSFPPPLTTISGSESLCIRAHREDGRLIINAIKAPSPHSNFQAERSHGRLRLYFVKESASNLDHAFDNHHNYAATNEENESNSDQTENEINYDKDDEEEEDEENGANIAEDIEANNSNVEGEMGIEEIQRPSRCKEERDLLLENNKGLLNGSLFGWPHPKLLLPIIN